MNDLLANFVLEPPAWPVLLTVTAAAMLLWEAAAIFLELYRQHGPLRAGMLTVLALGAGPLLLTSAVAAKVMRARPGLGRLTGVAARGCVVMALAMGVYSSGVRGGLVAVAACTVFWTLRSYSRTTTPLKRRWHVILLSLRLAAILLAVAIVFRPQYNYELEEFIRPCVLIGLDTSTSMQRRDVPTGKTIAGEPERITRIAAASAALRQANEQLDKLASGAAVEVFSFAGGAHSLAQLPGELHLDTPPPADGKTTALGDAPMAAYNDCMQRGQDVAAIVLLSDGCGNSVENLTPEDFASRMAVAGVPVNTVGVGSEEVSPFTRVLNVKELVSPDQVAAFNRLPIQARIEAYGLGGRKVKVGYSFGGDDPNAGGHWQVFDVATAQEVLTAEFVHVPLAAGFQRLKVFASIEGEPVRELGGQPVASKLVQVIDSELRVLYLEGKFRYEVKFITQALAAANRFAVDRRILMGTNGPAAAVLGEKEEDWLRYHAIILGDVSPSDFTPGQLEMIREMVRKYGKGLCMIGGSRSFGRGGWDKTPLADVLGVNLAASAGQIDRDVQVVPTPAGLTHGLMNIGDTGQDVAACWKQLAPLPGCNKLGGVKDAAEVLAATPAGDPLIVAQNYGGGRSLAIAFDMTWLWVTARDTGDLQRRFWRQVAMYLCAPKGNVWITTDKTSYDLARLVAAKEVVEVTAGVEDAQGLRLPEAPVTVTLTGPDGKSVPLAMVVDKDHRATRLTAFQVPNPGTYGLKVTAEVSGRTLTAEHGLEVVQRDLEALDVLANFKQLTRLASNTSGHFVPLAELDSLLSKITVSTHPRRRVRTESIDFAANLRWPVVFALIALACAEWVIRKRRGLV